MGRGDAGPRARPCGISMSWPRRRRDPSPRRPSRRGLAFSSRRPSAPTPSPRNIRVVAAAAPRPVPAEDPRHSRGGAATRPRGRSTSGASPTSCASRTPYWRGDRKEKTYLAREKSPNSAGCWRTRSCGGPASAEKNGGTTRVGAWAVPKLHGAFKMPERALFLRPAKLTAWLVTAQSARASAATSPKAWRGISRPRWHISSGDQTTSG